MRRLVSGICDAEPLEQRHGTRARAARIHRGERGPGPPGQFRSGRHHHVLGQRHVAKRTHDLVGKGEAELRAAMDRHAGDVAPVEQHAAAIRRQHTGEQAQQSGLAGAIRSDQAQQFAARHRQGHIHDGMHATKGDRQAAGFELIHAMRLPVTRPSRPARPSGLKRITASSSPP